MAESYSVSAEHMVLLSLLAKFGNVEKKPETSAEVLSLI